MRRTETAILLLAAALGFACGGASNRTDDRTAARGATGQTAPAPAPAAATRADRLGEFEPVSRADAELYLEVMRRAAERLRHLSAADREALKAFQQVTTNPPAAGAIPSPEQMAALQRAGELAALDSVVARELGVEERYSSISSRVSRFIGPEMTGEGDGDPMTAEQKAQLKIRIQKFRDLEKHDAGVLAPFREELVALDRQVHILAHPESMPR